MMKYAPAFTHKTHKTTPRESHTGMYDLYADRKPQRWEVSRDFLEQGDKGFMLLHAPSILSHFPQPLKIGRTGADGRG